MARCALAWARLSPGWEGWRAADEALAASLAALPPAAPPRPRPGPWALKARLDLLLHRSAGVAAALAAARGAALLGPAQRAELDALDVELARLTAPERLCATLLSAAAPAALDDGLRIRRAECLRARPGGAAEALALLRGGAAGAGALSRAWRLHVEGAWRAEEGAHEEAGALLDAAAALAPGWWEVARARVDLLAREGDHAAALDAARALAARGGRGDHWELAARLAARLGRAEEAEALAARAVEAHVALWAWASEVAFDHGAPLLAARDPARLLAWTEEVARRRPAPAAPLALARALALTALGRGEEARGAVEGLLAAPPGAPLDAALLHLLAAALAPTPAAAAPLRARAVLLDPEVLWRGRWLLRAAGR
ncbi:MAG: hypothetical protein FJ138_04855 [Deltaproteobacteria bacterium]|nr:hypothetical protein [Deltaproteobacteria bacterium]